MSNNIPRVKSEKDYQNFFDAVKSIVDTLTGKKRNTEYDQALVVRDLEKLGVNLDLFLNSNKRSPYTKFLEPLTYDDLQVAIQNIKLPASSQPAERLYNHGIVDGISFPVLGFDVNEYVYFDIQTSHSMKLNTVLSNHIHFMTPTDGSGTPDRFQFQLDVIVAGMNGSWTVPTGSPFTSEHTISVDYTNTHKLLEIAHIPASNTTVSSIYKCKLTRIAATQDEYSDEVYLEFTDCHYKKDTTGSKQESLK